MVLFFNSGQGEEMKALLLTLILVLIPFTVTVRAGIYDTLYIIWRSIFSDYDFQDIPRAECVKVYIGEPDE